MRGFDYMKNYKVKAIRFFRDSNEIDEKTGRKIERQINDEFYCTKERYEFLKANNAVKLIDEIVEDYDNVDFEIVQDWEKEEEFKQKPKKKKTSKK
jgi:hypothetical protein